MSLQNKILLVVGGGVVLVFLLLVVAYPLFFSGDADTPTTETVPTLQDRTDLVPLPADNATAPVVSQDSTVRETFVPQVVKLTNEQAQRAEIERLTRLFVERFGSYSNYSNFANIEALETFMTSSMVSYVDTTVLSQREQLKQGGYHGITTRLLRNSIQNLVLGVSATVDITVQQEVQDGLESPIEKKLVDGRVDLRYENDQWKVNGVFYNN
jgi:hypothetical protein